MDLSSIELQPPTSSQATDYGGIFHLSPLAVLKPKTPQDISLLIQIISSSSSYNSLTLAPRGVGHSTHGQAQALDGIVVDVTSLPRSIRVDKRGLYVDVDGGALWAEVLEETLKHGVAPRSWTDYLYLTVGGTLSVGGISGQTFKYGPQICNVVEMEVVTGRGDVVSCSEVENSDLFYGVLGGLGQFGVITRARILLHLAPKMVKWVRISYEDFDKFIEDEELLISMEEKVDYLEGFIRLNGISSSSSHFPAHLSSDSEENIVGANLKSTLLYFIEMAFHYNHGEEDEEEAVQKRVDEIVSGLKLKGSRVEWVSVSYIDFLKRVGVNSREVWEVPHPWVNLFVPSSHVRQFKELLLGTISATPTYDGLILFYPIPTHKWNPKMSAVLPEEDDIVYVIGLLRTSVEASSCTHHGFGSSASTLLSILEQNQKMIDIATSRAVTDDDDDDMMMTHACMHEGDGGMGGKQYLPYCRDEREWRVHFGDEGWERFKGLKSKFDPLNILTPGQRIFKRKTKESLST